MWMKFILLLQKNDTLLPDSCHLDILVWEISWTEETDELQSMGHKELEMT